MTISSVRDAKEQAAHWLEEAGNELYVEDRSVAGFRNLFYPVSGKRLPRPRFGAWFEDQVEGGHKGAEAMRLFRNARGLRREARTR